MLKPMITYGMMLVRTDSVIEENELNINDQLWCSIAKKSQIIRSSDNDSTGLWPPGSLHTLGADGHI